MDIPEPQKGDPILADDFVKLIHLASEKSLSAIPRKVMVYNASGVNVGLGGILGIDQPMAQYLPSVSVPQFIHPHEVNLQGVAPTVADHLGKWVVPLQPINDERDGDCVADGIARVRVYVNGADDAYCDVDAGHSDGDYTCYLGTGASGAQILWRENEGSGAETVVWAIVRLGKATGPIPFMLKTSLTLGGTADAYPTEPDGTIISTSLYITVTDTIGDKRAIGKDDRAAGGALGLAEVLGDGTLAIIELQPVGLWLLAQASDVAAPDEEIPLMNHQLLNPIGGILASFPATAANIFAQTFAYGDYLLVMWGEEAAQWGGFKAGSGDSLILVELKTDLAPGGSADAYALTWDAEGSFYAAVLESYFTVYDDPLRNHRGRGRDNMGEGQNGSWGIVRYSPLSGRLEIVNLHEQAKRCKCLSYGATTDTLSSFTVDNIAPTDGGLNPVNSTGDGVILTVYIQLNPSSNGGVKMADNTVCFIEWHEDDDKWYFYDAPCDSTCRCE